MRVCSKWCEIVLGLERRASFPTVEADSLSTQDFQGISFTDGSSTAATDINKVKFTERVNAERKTHNKWFGGKVVFPDIPAAICKYSQACQPTNPPPDNPIHFFIHPLHLSEIHSFMDLSLHSLMQGKQVFQDVIPNSSS